MKWLLLILLTLHLAACTKPREYSLVRELPDSVKVDSHFVPLDSTQSYFPAGLFENPTEKEDLHEHFMFAHYSWFLWAMKEPLLYPDKKDEKEVFRFTWLRTFHEPIVIRIEHLADNFRLIWKINDGHGGYSPGKNTIVNEKEISKSVWDEFQVLVKQASFEDLPILEHNRTVDGAAWILEWKTPSRYYITDRQSPIDGDTNYAQIGEYLIRLAGVFPTEREYY